MTAEEFGVLGKSENILNCGPECCKICDGKYIALFFPFAWVYIEMIGF